MEGFNGREAMGSFLHEDGYFEDFDIFTMEVDKDFGFGVVIGVILNKESDEFSVDGAEARGWVGNFLFEDEVEQE